MAIETKDFIDEITDEMSLEALSDETSFDGNATVSRGSDRTSQTIFLSRKARVTVRAHAAAFLSIPHYSWVNLKIYRNGYECSSSGETRNDVAGSQEVFASCQAVDLPRGQHHFSARAFNGNVANAEFVELAVEVD